MGAMLTRSLSMLMLRVSMAPKTGAIVFGHSSPNRPGFGSQASVLWGLDCTPILRRRKIVTQSAFSRTPNRNQARFEVPPNQNISTKNARASTRRIGVRRPCACSCNMEIKQTDRRLATRVNVLFDQPVCFSACGSTDACAISEPVIQFRARRRTVADVSKRLHRPSDDGVAANGATRSRSRHCPALDR